MNRRDCLSGLLQLPFIAAIGCASRTAQPAPARRLRTRWTVGSSEGLDLLCFLGPLSGDPFYARYYSEELAQFAPRLDAGVIGTIQRLKSSLASHGAMLGPPLCLLFSAGPTGTLADIRSALDRAEHQLLPGFRDSPYFDAEGWAWFIEARPALARVFEAAATAEFPAFRQAIVGDRVARRASALHRRLAGIDMIAEQERLLGRPLHPDITIDLMYFSQPHGIKVIGQRFLTHLDYPGEIVIRNAAHEILHPPFDVEHPAIRAAQAVLRRDTLLTRIVAEHDPSFGYRSLEGYFDEDTAQALEQIINGRIGVAVPPKERWRTADDGMHVLAAGLYGLLRADGFDRTGGSIQDWLGMAARDGRLAPASLHPAAAAVLEVPHDRLWVPPPAKAAV